MPTPARRYSPEFWVNALLYFPMLLCYASILLEREMLLVGLIFQFFLGVFQVVCAGIHSLKSRSERHGNYLFFVICFFLAMVVGFWLLYLLNEPELVRIIFSVFILFVVPIITATWYLNMVSWYYGNEQQKVVLPSSQEDILDDLPIV